MKRIAVALAVTVAALLFAAVAFAQPHPFAFEDMMAIRRIGAPQVSPDGKWIAYDASTIDLKANVRRSAIYLIPSSGGASKQISDGTKQDEGPAWSPDGKTIAYVSNRDGGAKQVWLYDVATGQSRKVSDLEGGAGTIKWAPDGSAVLLVSDIYPDCGVDPACIKNKTVAEAAAPTKVHVATSLLYRHWTAWQSPTRTHVLYYPLSGSNVRDLTPGAFDAPPFSLGGGDEFDISPDGREVVYARNTDVHPELSTNSDLFLVPVTGGEAKRITTRQGADTSPKYSPDGRWIAWRSQATPAYESDLFELWLYDRTNGKTTRLMPQFDNWVDSFTWAPDSKSIYFVAPLKASEAIYQVPISGGEPQLLMKSGSADALTVSRDGKTVYYDVSSLMSPTDIFALTKVTGGARGVKLTHDNDALLSSIAMGATQDQWYTGAAGAQIQALMVLPPGFDRTRKYPAVVLIHGGPQGAWEDAWSYRWNPQMYAARGYVVFMPNPRGSTGYGQQFVREISGDWGGKAYVDIMNGVDLLAAMPFVDANRLGAAGRLLRRLHGRLDPRPHRPLQGPGLACRRLRSALRIRSDGGALVPGVRVRRSPLGKAGRLREMVAGQLRHELQDADARLAGRDRLPRPGQPGTRALHGLAEARRTVEADGLPRRRPFHSQASEREVLLQDGARLDRSVAEASGVSLPVCAKQKC